MRTPACWLLALLLAVGPAAAARPRPAQMPASVVATPRAGDGVPAALPNATELVAGFLDGFFEVPAPDVDACVADDARALSDAVKAVETLQHNKTAAGVEEALADLDAMVASIAGAMESCGAAAGELKKVKAALEEIKSLRELLRQLGTNLLAHHAAVFAHLEAAVASGASGDWTGAGRAAGEAVQLVLLGAPPGLGGARA